MPGLRSLLIATLGLVALSDCKPSSTFAGSSSRASKNGSGTGSSEPAGTSTDPVILRAGTNKNSTDVLPQGAKVEGCLSTDAKIATCDPATGVITGVSPGDVVVKVRTPEGDKDIHVRVTPASTLGGNSTGATGLPTTDSGSGGAGTVDTGALIGKADAGGLLIDDGGRPCLDKLMPLNIMIALDVTGSMTSNINAIRDNVLQFAQVVRTIVPEGAKGPIPDIKIGAITYVDDVADQQLIPLTDPASFAAQAQQIDIRGPLIHDHCEGGIAATRNAMQALATAGAASGGEAVPMIVVVSDNYSHDSVNGEGARTFDMTPVIAAAQAPQFRNLLFFDAIPTTTNVPLISECPGVPNSLPPSAQWQNVRLAWKAAHPGVIVEPGRNLGFPFTQSTLLTTLPAELRRLLRVCTAVGG